jgi:hypothetical protein
MHVDAGLDTRIERRDRAVGFGEPASDLDLELWAAATVDRDPCENVTGPQTQSEPVRLVDDNGVVGIQAKC